MSNAAGLAALLIPFLLPFAAMIFNFFGNALPFSLSFDKFGHAGQP